MHFVKLTTTQSDKKIGDLVGVTTKFCFPCELNVIGHSWKSLRVRLEKISFDYHPSYSAPPPQVKTSQNKWPSPPPLPQRSPRIRRRHNLRNYASLASTNRSQEKRNSVGAPPLDSLTTSITIAEYRNLDT